MNILTFDVEEWFHLLDFDATRNEEQWKNYEVRIYENVDRILDILESTDTKATLASPSFSRLGIAHASTALHSA